MKPKLLDGLQIDDFCTKLYVEIDGENTILTFKNGRGTMQNIFILDRDSLRWLIETLQNAEQEIKKHEEYSDYRYIPPIQPETSSIAIGTFDKYVKIIINTPYNMLETNLMLSVDDVKWLSAQLQHNVDAIIHSTLESEATER